MIKNLSSRATLQLINFPARQVRIPSVFTWFARYSKNGTSILPSFSKIDHIQIEQEAGISSNATYLNSLFWTPRFYQASSLSTEFE